MIINNKYPNDGIPIMNKSFHYLEIWANSTSKTWGHYISV